MNRDLIKKISTIINKNGTADPFKLADDFNVDVVYKSMGKRPLGQIAYYGGEDDYPIVILNESIKEEPIRYQVMAHELGHLIRHTDTIAYYNIAGRGKMEREANEFSKLLLTQYYYEDTGRFPSTIHDLNVKYGVPEE